MLRFISPTGTLEASAADEKRVRALSDAALCAELNRPLGDIDPFAVAELRQRPHLRFHSTVGWRSGAAVAA